MDRSVTMTRQNLATIRKSTIGVPWISHKPATRTVLSSQSCQRCKFSAQKSLHTLRYVYATTTHRTSACRSRCLITRSGNTTIESQSSKFSQLAIRRKKQPSKRVTTFSPLEAVKSDLEEPEINQNERLSFLQQKAKSVMNRRAEAAALSSMTGAERAAFDDIWKMFEPAHPPVTTDKKLIDQHDTDYRNLLELFDNLSQNDGEIDLDRSTHVTDEDVDCKETRPSQSVIDSKQHEPENFVDADPLEGALPANNKPSAKTDNIDATAMKLVQDISSSFDIALRSTTPSPEAAMWEVCEQKVFPLTKLLIPTKNKMTSRPDIPEPQPQPQPQSQPTHPLIPADVPLIPLLIKVYPTTLLLALRLYQRHHPTSAYTTSLLPHIKSLGPTSYVLGANTHFYNTLCAIRWDIYSDLDEISNLLAEMDRTGLEYDNGTAELLRRISTERECDLRGDRSDVLSRVRRERGVLWWKRSLVDRSWKRFSQWKALVTRRLEEKGIGEVMREGGFDSFDIDTGMAFDGHANSDAEQNRRGRHVVTL